jgi:nitrate reductase gamma subunit
VISKADIFILVAVVIAFVLGVYLFFHGERDKGVFVATWVPAILAFGIYFKLLRQQR